MTDLFETEDSSSCKELEFKSNSAFVFKHDPDDVIALHPTALDAALNDKVKKGTKRKRVVEDTVETAKRRSARVRNTKCKKEEKIDFQELLLKFLPSRCLFKIILFRGLVQTCCDHIKQCTRRLFFLLSISSFVMLSESYQ